MTDLFLEAEAFEELGGWVIDQQSMQKMGSSYIMAHGLGIPVADAKTKCEIEEEGTWNVFVRTRDWTAVWNRGSSGGIFKIAIDGIELPEILGTCGKGWNWQKAGTIRLKRGTVELSLKDLTGFNARCDAVYMTTDLSFVPVNDKSELAVFRKLKAKTICNDDPGEYDLAVAGGGIAGICTAFAAIRLGLKVVLIHDRGVLGGCNSSEIRVGLGGFTHVEPYRMLGNVVDTIAPIKGGPGTYPKEYYEDFRKKNIFELFPKELYRLSLNESVVEIEKDKDDSSIIRSFITHNTITGAETRYKARFFADCTGDAVVSRLAGAKIMYGCEPYEKYHESLAPEKSTNQVMGQSVLWYSKKCVRPASFPDIDWGLEFNEDNVLYVREGDWEWESGQYRNQAEETEYIRDYGLMALFSNWSYLKNHSKRKEEWAYDTLEWASPIGGKRESYRVVGDLVLTQNDIEEHIVYPDATASITWSIDLHFPDPDNEEKFPEPFRSCAYHRGIEQPYPVPYRCLYARDVKNLFLGGRHISVSHVAFSCVRVMRTLGMLGEVIGMAASICAQKNISPRELYETDLNLLKDLMRKGISVPSYHAYASDDRESYHFKELGFFHVYPDCTLPFHDKILMNRINKLNIHHKHQPKIK